jgi:SP family general alpha glucoside:H+ symporter-like MFS transporter
LINGFYAFPSFVKRYGHQIPNGEYEITTAWQQSLINGAVVGEIFGLMFNGIMVRCPGVGVFGMTDNL